MSRSATEVMQDVIYAAVIDAIAGLKAGAGNLPNNLLRDLGAIHANTTFADLPEGVRKAIETNVRAAFTRLLKEGYNVSSGSAPPARPSGPPRDRVPSRGPHGRPQGRRPAGERGPRDGGGGHGGGGHGSGGHGGGGGNRGPRKPGGGGKPGGGKPR